MKKNGNTTRKNDATLPLDLEGKKSPKTNNNKNLEKKKKKKESRRSQESASKESRKNL